MKTLSISLALGLAATHVAAFPAMMTDPNSPMAKAAREAGLFKDLEARQLLGGVAPQGAGALPLVPPPFNAAQQRVNNKGIYKFVAPTLTDARGPCPGLNAMANHGYIPHNGVASIQQFIDGTWAVFGMGRDLSGFLATYGAIVDGNGTHWSIAGVPHTGIGGSHNNYEADSSPMRADLDQYGTNSRLVMYQFKEFFAMQSDPATANYNLEVLRNFRRQRLIESKANNPRFTYLPFGGIQVSQAAFTFIYRFMSNKSAEAPEGILNQQVLKSFMSVTGTGTNLVWNKGKERIPDNWYKRNDLDAYTVPYFESDILYFAQTVPEILAVGCNTGTRNSYNQIDASVISNGAYTAQTAAANPMCFASAFGAAQAKSLAGLSAAQISQLTTAFDGVTSALGVTCPAITDPNVTAFAACPGFSFYGGPTGPIAKGAVRP